MNFYWGDSPMSWLRFMTLASFRVHNPEAPITIHTASGTSDKPWKTPQHQEFMGWKGQDWRDRLDELGVEWVQAESFGTPNHSADMCRWKVLSQGGQFADMDIIWTKPLPEIEGDAITCEDGIYFLGLTSGEQGGIFESVYEHAKGMGSGQYQSYGVMALYHMTQGDAVFDAHGDVRWNAVKPSPLRFIPIPKWWVHPIDVNACFLTNKVPECYGIHWFAGSERGQRATRRWTPESFGNCAIGKGVRAAWEAL